MSRTALCPLLTVLALAVLPVPAHAVLIGGKVGDPANSFDVTLTVDATLITQYNQNPQPQGKRTALMSWKVQDRQVAWPNQPRAGALLQRPLAAITATGTFTESGTAYLTPPNPPADPYSCSGSLTPVTTSKGITRSRRAADSGFNVEIPAITSISFLAPRCSPDTFAPAAPGGGDLEFPATSRFAASQAQLATSGFTIPVSGGASGIPCGPGVASGGSCTQTLTLSGKAAFEKVCRNGSARLTSASGTGEGSSCASPCRASGCDRPVLGVEPKLIELGPRGTGKVKVDCYGRATCGGKGKLYEIRAGGSAKRRKRPRAVAGGSFKVKAGRTGSARLKLNKLGRRLLRKGKRRRFVLDLRLSGKRVGERTTKVTVPVRRKRR